MTITERSESICDPGQRPADQGEGASAAATRLAEWEALPQSQRRHVALWPEDTEDRTFGCRASNPETCGKHGMRRVCAFVREDSMCLAPPQSWAKQYLKLLAGESARPPIGPT